jgi:hypothetical protein
MADFFTESFAGSDGANLTTLGWSKHPSNDGNMLITSGGRILCGSVTGACFYLAPVTPSEADYSVTAKVRKLNNGDANGFGVLGRLNSSAYTCYLAVYNTPDSKWYLYSVVAGSYLSLGNSLQSLSVDTDYTLELVMDGDQISLKVDGSTIIGPVTNSAVTATGQPGVWAFANTASTNTTQLHLDDFVASSFGSLAASVGIASTLVVGDPVASVGTLAASVGIASTLTVGEPAATYGALAASVGIASTLVIGDPVASVGGLAASVGIASTLVIGDPVASVGGLAASVGIASTLVIGDPVASVGGLAASVGIASTLIVGSPAGSYGTLATSVGIASTLVVGSPLATWEGVGPNPQSDIRVAFFLLIGAETDLTNVVGARIYPAPRPQSAVLPCLTYRLITSNPGHDLGAADGTVRSRFQVEAWSRTTAEAAALSVGLFNALDGFVGTVDGIRITWIAKLDEADLSSLESDGTGDPKRRIVSDYLVQYRVAIPTR